MLSCIIVLHVHLLHPVRAGNLVNWLAKKLVSLLAISLVRCAKARIEFWPQILHCLQHTAPLISKLNCFLVDRHTSIIFCGDTRNLAQTTL